MKAVVCNKFGSLADLVVEDFPSPQPGPGQVLVEVKAAGVNYADPLMVQGKYQDKPALPFTPGVELAGVVKQLGSGVTAWMVGQPVYGSRLRGAFAEEVVIDADKLLSMPATLSFEQAGCLSAAYNTSYYALALRAALQPGESVLVLGAAGGVGLAAVEIAKAMGAKVIAAASSAEKLDLCAAHGADELVDYSREDLRQRIKEIAGTGGVNVVCDPVGGPYAEPALRSLAWGGRYLVVGFASGDIPRLPLNLVLLKGASVIGVLLGEARTRDPRIIAQIDDGMQALLHAGKIQPHVSGRYPFERAAEAMGALLNRQATGKIVLVP